jgi:hypothetical protein
MSRLLTLLLLSAGAWAQIDPPALGVSLDPNRCLRLIRGVPGALSLSEPLASGVLSAAGSGPNLIWKTSAELVALNGRRWDAPSGPALFALDAQGRATAVWFPDIGELDLLTPEALTPLPFIPEGEVRGLASPHPGHIRVLVAGPDSLRLLTFRVRPFRIESDTPLPAAPANLVLLPGGDLFSPAGLDDDALRSLDWQPAAPGYLSATNGSGSQRLLRLADRTAYTVPEVR